MHRSYNSILPCQSRLLQSKWDKAYYDEHRKKVRDAGPMVDTKAPPTYIHLHMKLKTLQLEEERLATIERDNRILLEKMSYIMRTRGRIDNRNDYEYRSLNKEKRQRELLRVTRENQEILRRIMQRQPEYNHEKWDQDWEENQRYMDSISHFPKDWWEEKEQKGEKSAKGKRERKADKKDDQQKYDNEDDNAQQQQTQQRYDDDEDNDTQQQQQTQQRQDTQQQQTQQRHDDDDDNDTQQQQQTQQRQDTQQQQTQQRYDDDDDNDTQQQQQTQQ